jgi:hypothetical protein
LEAAIGSRSRWKPDGCFGGSGVGRVSTRAVSRLSPKLFLAKTRLFDVHTNTQRARLRPLKRSLSFPPGKSSSSRGQRRPARRNRARDRVCSCRVSRTARRTRLSTRTRTCAPPPARSSSLPANGAYGEHGHKLAPRLCRRRSLPLNAPFSPSAIGIALEGNERRPGYVWANSVNKD